MIKNRIEALIEVLREEPSVPRGANRGFNMRHIFHDCGTPSCIAGYAITLFGDAPKENKELTPTDVIFHGATARKLLDLTVDTAEELFFPDSIYDNFRMEDVKAKDAVKALQLVLKGNTGNLWDKNFYDYEEDN